MEARLRLLVMDKMRISLNNEEITGQKFLPSDQPANKNKTWVLFPILLIGCLSMLFAEVFSGASQRWFINGWGIFVTFPLYLAHVLFFWWIALKLKKTSLSQLYFFGVIFALYESWIPKVLWAGYNDATGSGWGTFLGLRLYEFPILVFFWHPIMSFILPILVFEVLTGKILIGHAGVLRKSKNKTTFIVLFLLAISTFIANGNKFNLISANSSLIGTLLLVSGLYYSARKASLKIFEFSRTGFITVTAYLFLLYVSTFLFLRPERIPQTILPYVSIIVVYAVLILLIRKSKKTETEFTGPDPHQYSIKDLVSFVLITILSVNVACLTSNTSWKILLITYFMLTFIGTITFISITYQTLRQGNEICNPSRGFSRKTAYKK